MKLYIDTSVFGGLFDQEFETDSLLFFNLIEKQNDMIVYSDVVVKEIALAPRQVQELFNGLANTVRLKTTNSMKKLAKAYIASGALRAIDINDAEHVACATISKCDMVISWNFTHLANKLRVMKYNIVNTALGYNFIEIISPKHFYDTYQEKIK